jgi:hypothetical protein
MTTQEPNSGLTSTPDTGDAELRLPRGLVEALRREAGDTGSWVPEVPTYVDVAVMRAFEAQQARGATRRQTWRFAGVAAAAAGLLWVGSLTWPGRGSQQAPTTTLVDGAITGGMSADLTSNLKRREMAAESVTHAGAIADAASSVATMDRVGEAGSNLGRGAPGAPIGPAGTGGGGGTEGGLALLALDVDQNGRRDVLDVLRMAKTIEAVRLAAIPKEKKLEADYAMEQSALKFFVETLDVTWDLTADGTVDQRDVDLMTSRIVRVSKGGA